MPYAVRQTPTGWVKVKTIATDSVVSHHKTKEDAIAAIRAYYANKRKMEAKLKK